MAAIISTTMNFLSSKKNIVTLTILFILLFAGYIFFFGGEGGGSDSLLTSETADIGKVSPLSRSILLTLGDLQNIKLDDSIFSNATFESLVDFGVEIPTKPVGRSNPFAPAGS